MSRSLNMATTPIPRLVWGMSWPLIISLLVQSLYNIVDSIFVAQIGEEALTAVGLAFPIQLLMIAVSVGTAVGVNALLSRSIGAKQYERTENIATSGLLLSIGGMILFMLLGLFCSGWFVGLFTDNATIANYTQTYLFICMLFCGGTFVGTMYQRFLQSIGNTFDSMLTLVAGALTNLALDPLLIFGIGPFPTLGITGAAIATVVGQWVCAVLAVLLNNYHNPVVNVKLNGYKPNRNIFAAIYRVGLPTIITQALGSVMVSAINAILIGFSPTAVAFFGVYYKLQSFLFMPMNGMGQAAIPIVGFSYGAKKPERIREMLRIMLPAAVVVSLVMTLVFLIFPEALLRIFDASDAMLALGVPALRIISPTFALASITMILGYSVSGLGVGTVNMWGTGLRQVIVLIPGVWLLSSQFGVEYAWYAFWASELIACAYAIIKARNILREKGVLTTQPQTVLQTN